MRRTKHLGRTASQHRIPRLLQGLSDLAGVFPGLRALRPHGVRMVTLHQLAERELDLFGGCIARDTEELVRGHSKPDARESEGSLGRAFGAGSARSVRGARRDFGLSQARRLVTLRRLAFGFARLKAGFAELAIARTFERPKNDARCQCDARDKGTSARFEIQREPPFGHRGFQCGVAWGQTQALRAFALLVCLPWGGAEITPLTARSDCAMRALTREGVRLCLSEAEAARWLGAGEPGPRRTEAHVACFEARGRWAYARDPERAVFQVQGLAAQAVVSAPEFGPGREITAGLQRLRLRLRALLLEARASPLLLHLLLGINGDPLREDALRSLGFVHLLSPSGIHLWALAAWVNFCAGVCARRLAVSARWVLWIQGLATIGVWLAAWMLQGLKWGMLRPVLVVGARLGAQRAGVRWRAFSPLLCSLSVEALALAVRTPAAGESRSWAQFAAHGRWHYAAAVGFGLWAAEMVRADEASTTDGWRAHLRLHAAMAVGSWIPIALAEVLTQGWTSVLTPLWSLLTIPVIAQLVYPAGLLALAGSGFSAGGSAALLRGLSSVTEALLSVLVRASESITGIWIVSPGALLAGAVLACAVLGVARTPAMGSALRRRIALSIGVALLAATAARMTPLRMSLLTHRDDSVSQLRVGQGDAALVALRSGAGTDATGLIDAGPPGTLRLSQWLTAMARTGSGSLDWVLLTHADADHTAGLWALARWTRIGCVGAPRGLVEKSLWVAPLAPYADCVPSFAGRAVVSEIAERGANGVMGGIAIRLQTRQGQKLYVNLGDATVRGERRLWGAIEREISAPLPATRILKLSHHGSHTSSGEAFLRSLRPTEAWISFGAGNSYGHPHLDVLERVRELGIPIRSTAGGDLF